MRQRVHVRASEAAARRLGNTISGIIEARHGFAGVRPSVGDLAPCLGNTISRGTEARPGYAGVTQSAVYFVTPTELTAAPVPGKAYRLGGMVEKGSVSWEPRTLALTFRLTDGKTTVNVNHHGTRPDLFGEGRGAVVEGTWG